VRPKWDPASVVLGEAPFPSDAFLADDGRIGLLPGLERFAPDSTDLARRHLRTLDGFGLRPLVQFPIDGDVDPVSFDGAIHLVDVDPSSPDRGARIPMEWRFDPDRQTIGGALSPGHVLAERRRYAAVLTTDVRSSAGGRIGRAPMMDALDGPRWRSTAEGLAAVEEMMPGAEVAALATFRTGGPSEVLVAARARLEDRALVPMPAIVMDGPVFSGEALDALLGTVDRDEHGAERIGWRPTGVAHDAVGAIAHGVLHRCRMRRDETAGDGPDDETFELDGSRAPRVVAPDEPIPVTMVLPKQRPPVEGWPIVIIGHGLGASRHAIVTFAEPLAREGFALIAIDMEGHGSRWRDVDEANNTASIADAFSGDPALADGFGDVTGPLTTLDLLEGLENLSAVRDSFLQSVLDLSQLAMALRRTEVDLSAVESIYGAPVAIDGRAPAYLGESFGAVIGGIFAAVEPDVHLFVLDVGGGGVIDLIIPSSPLLSQLLVPLGRSVYGVEGAFDRFHPFVALAGSLLDGADPLTYAPHHFRDRFDVAGPEPRHVVVLEVIDDELMSNIGTEAFARAAGLELLEPFHAPIPGVLSRPSPASANLDGQTGILVQYAPATHGGNWSSETGVRRFYPSQGDQIPGVLPEPIEIRNPIHETFEQVVGILRSASEGAPIVRSTAAPTHDFDGDGMSDEDERASGQNPYGS
jgi:hypothetical protein